MNTAALPQPVVEQIEQLIHRKRFVAFVVPILITAYLAYIFVAFDVIGLAQRANVENARSLVADSYSYKTHVTRDNRNGEISVSIEGERKGRYESGTSPSWVTMGPTTRVRRHMKWVVRAV